MLKEEEKNERSSREKLSRRDRKRERGRSDGRKKKVPHHNHAANWFSAVNLCSVFGQAISKMGEHEIISQRIYLDKSRGC